MDPAMTLAAFVPPAVVTLAIAVLLFGCALRVGRMRMRHGIDAPATTGHPDLEIALRVQMNTLENAVLVLPPLWLASAYLGPRAAALAGAAWIAARVWYAIAYSADPRRRGGGFVAALLAWVALMAMAAWGIAGAALA
jgi:glutathione S-transferase